MKRKQFLIFAPEVVDWWKIGDKVQEEDVMVIIVGIVLQAGDKFCVGVLASGGVRI